MKHKSVLLQEVLTGLNLHQGDTFLDGTLGSAGHTQAVMERFKESVGVVGIDRDAEALKRSEEKLRTLPHNFFLRRGSFRDMDKVLADLGIKKVNAVLLDLGISSDQLDDSGRGFSFKRDEPLDMRMSGEGITAAEVLNSWSERAIALILKGFGEEKHARAIARRIVERREIKPFQTTSDLVEVVGGKQGKIHPATRTFQAIRIAVNEELDALEEGLSKALELLDSKGRLVVISFHSLEDRIVKNFMREKVKSGEANLITQKPIVPKEGEIRENPRARSAKLRILEKK